MKFYSLTSVMILGLASSLSMADPAPQTTAPTLSTVVKGVPLSAPPVKPAATTVANPAPAVAPAAAIATPEIKDELPVTDADKAIVLTQKNPVVTITLKSNPTTGFSWFLKSYNPGLLTITKEHFIAPNQMVPGRGGYDQWTFRATKNAFKVPRVTYVTLLYGQPWNLLTATEREFTIVTTKQ